LLFTFLLGKDFWIQNQRGMIIVFTFAMFFLGLYDDLFVLGARRKLFGQLVIASLTYLYGIGPEAYIEAFLQILQGERQMGDEE